MHDATADGRAQTNLFHYGHVDFLRKARELGTYLIAGVVADDVIEPHKEKPIRTMGERVASVAGSKYVDQVVPNAPWRIDRARIIQLHIQLVVHGDDYAQEQLDDIYKVPMESGILRTVPYTKGISTTEIIRRILERND